MMLSEQLNMSISERRRKRQRMFELMAMMHSGLLGFDLYKQVIKLAEELYDLNTFVAPKSKPTAGMYRLYQNNCLGSNILSCSPGSDQECLLSKFSKLARSASKGADKRRLSEAEYIKDDVLICLKAKLDNTSCQPYIELLSLSIDILTIDAEYNEQFQCRH